MINLDEALEPVRKMIENESYSHEGAYAYKGEIRDRWYKGELDYPNEDSKNLRLDWELADAAQGKTQDVARLILDNLKLDLEDLIENGDIDQTSGPLLKTWNGSKKRGQELVEFVVLHAHLEKEYKKNKKSTEYTLFIRPYLKWQ